MPAPSSHVRPAGRALELLAAWALVGLQSFGGGNTTLALIHRHAVERRGWVTEAEFTRLWALCQVAPGINLLALAILLGRRVAGWRGILAALAGLLGPSVAITLLLTAGLASVRESAAAHAALQGLVPATVGIGLATASAMARPLAAEAAARGPWRLAAAAGIAMASGLLVAAGAAAALPVLMGAGAASACLALGRSAR